MIIFTVTNKVTKQIYVGSTRNDLESQWEKMVAATHQNLDYPLYQEIRTHGEEEFIVEEWDRAESREELAELEQDAIDFLGAEPLRGYKTSTVKILPKQKKRQRKSSIEKELVSIFAEINEEETHTSPSLTIKSTEVCAETTKSFSQQPETKPVPAAQAVQSLVQTRLIAASTAVSAQEIKVVTQQPEIEQPKLAVAKTAGSRACAMVQMNAIEISDDITARLAAITDAADACLAGDNSALSQLDVPPVVEESTTQRQAVEVKASTSAEKESEKEGEKEGEKERVAVEPICPKERRIREAIERHRKQRAQRSTESQEGDRKKMAETLTELDTRIREMQTGKLAPGAR